MRNEKACIVADIQSFHSYNFALFTCAKTFVLGAMLPSVVDDASFA